MSNHHIVLDLETMSTDTRAAVVSIGAVTLTHRTTPSGKQWKVGNNLVTGRSFYTTLSVHEQYSRGRTHDPKTIEWWNRDEIQTEAREAYITALTSPFRNTERLLEDFAQFVRLSAPSNTTKIKLWGNGPEFDNAVLKSLFNDFGVVFPFDYDSARSVRNAADLLPKETIPRPKPVIPHHALCDATAEGEWLCNIQNLLPQGVTLLT